MHWLKKALLGLLLITLLAAGVGYWFFTTRDSREYSRVMYHNNCASCHHANLQGTTPGTNLLAAQLKYGDDVNLLIESIERLPVHHQIEWSEEVTATTAKALALFISERRQAYPSIASSYEHQFLQKSVSSQYHRFSVEKFSALESRPYSIAPLPNGNIIVAEKVRGLSIVDENGAQGALINGAPTTHEQFLSVEGTYVGWGQLLEVALHPQYAENGWVYISFTDRCQLTCGSPVPKTMVKVIRGRIDDNEWVDQQVIWSVHQDYYTIVPDAVAGGRLGFDKQGHIFITIGGKANYKHLHNMDTPYGKVHRVRLDGSVPEDNPFWESADARAESSTRHTVWSYGHRTAQGLEGHPITGEIWESEMGPRGGDEVNKIVAGGNYGWPLYTNGLDYDSTEISIGEDLGLNFPIEDTVLPAVDFTPAPALSNLTFHNGDIFTQWESDILIGSLKALTLYRLRFKDDALVEKETLVTELGRIRDVEMGADGFVYIAIEHNDDGSIVRLVPE